MENFLSFRQGRGHLFQQVSTTAPPLRVYIDSPLDDEPLSLSLQQWLSTTVTAVPS
jgi:hypothetical protein